MGLVVLRERMPTPGSERPTPRSTPASAPPPWAAAWEANAPARLCPVSGGGLAGQSWALPTEPHPERTRASSCQFSSRCLQPPPLGAPGQAVVGNWGIGFRALFLFQTKNHLAPGTRWE